MRRGALKQGFSAFASVSLMASPALADDASTGFFAGLGLSAADGKTTLGTNAGTIEAAILSSDAFLDAGRTIRSLATSQALQLDRSGVLVLTHSDTLDFTMAHYIDLQTQDLRSALPPDSECATIKSTTTKVKKTTQRLVNGKPVGKPKTVIQTAPGTLPKPAAATPAATGGTTQTSTATTKTTNGFSREDVTAALATSANVSGVSITTDDRLLVNAVLINAPKEPRWRDLDKLPPPRTAALAPSGSMPRPGTVRFAVPTDLIDFSNTSSLIGNYRWLGGWAYAHRKCTSAAFGAALTNIQAFQTSVMSANKGTPPLVTAAELLTISAQKPLVLRLAIEQVGGTATSRSNIWYALGYPGAAQVSAGILVSFRMSDPTTGTEVLTGYVRCTTKPMNLRDVHRAVNPDRKATDPKNEVTCGVITG